MTASRPTVFCNPTSDGTFVAAVTGLATNAGSAGDLQRSLRRIYPRAVVRARDLSGERDEIWYVYRDGHWTPDGRAT